MLADTTYFCNMIKYLLLLLFITNNFLINAQCGALNQTFAGATPANPPTGWDANGIEFKPSTPTAFNLAYQAATTDSFRAGLNAVGEFIRTKLITCPDSVAFYWRSSGGSNSFAVAIEYSTDNVNWITMDSIVAPNNVYTLKKIDFADQNLLPPFAIYVRWYMYRWTSGACYVDQICMAQGVCHAVASEVQFKSYTTNCVPSDVPFSVQACATDNNGYTDTTYNGPVTLSLASGAGTLGGTLTQNAIAGCAAFNNVTFTGANPFSINATAGSNTSLSPLTSLNVQVTCPNVDTLKVVTYNVLNYPYGGQYSLGGACSPQETNNTRADTLRAIMDYMKPDILIVQELQSQGGADSILSQAFNVNGVTKFAMAPYIPNQSTANKNYNNECFYNTDKLVLLQGTTIPTSIRDIGVYKFYLKDPLLNVHNDTTWLDMYSVHTKAKGLGAAQATLDSIQRAADCVRTMDSIRARQSTERNAIIGGDMNLYTSAEGAYIAFTTGLYKFNDPVNQPGAWESNFAFRELHTQAARSGSRLSLECGARGGLDSRLDFLLNTDPLINGTQHITYIPNTYKATGNDRNLFNRSVDSNVAASSYPANFLRQLANMSDHIPVEELLAVQYPANTTLSTSNNISLNSKQITNNINLFWNIITDKTISTVDLLCNGSVIFTTNNAANNTFTHNNLKAGNYIYKIRVKLTDGSYLISNITTHNFTQGYGFEIIPNPIKDNVVIYGSTNVINNVQVTITDVRGVVIATATEKDFINGICNLPSTNWTSGIYFVNIKEVANRTTLKVLKP